MEALGILLWVIVTIVWIWPESLGRWLKHVYDGFGPINIRYDTHVHIKNEDKDTPHE